MSEKEGTLLTAQVPFLTASSAYSTWKRCPSGEKTVRARSYERDMVRGIRGVERSDRQGLALPLVRRKMSSEWPLLVRACVSLSQASSPLRSDGPP